MAKNSMDCDDLTEPSRTGFDPSMDWRRCLQKDLSTRSEVALTVPTASVSSDLIGAVAVKSRRSLVRSTDRRLLSGR